MEQQVQADEEEEGESRWELIRKLVEYKKFKDAADKLETLEHTQENVTRACRPSRNLRCPRIVARA